MPPAAASGGASVWRRSSGVLTDSHGVCENQDVTGELALLAVRLRAAETGRMPAHAARRQQPSARTHSHRSAGDIAEGAKCRLDCHVPSLFGSAKGNPACGPSV